HSRVFAGGEMRLVRTTLGRVPQEVGSQLPPCRALAQLDVGSVARLAESHLTELSKLAPGQQQRIVDKLPDNYLHLGFLAALFPRGTFVAVRRDVRDVALSCWMTDFRSIRWASDRGQITHRIRQYQRIMDHWRRVIPQRLFELDYEALVGDFEPSARALVAAC